MVSKVQHYHHNKRMAILLNVSFKPVIPSQNSKLNHYIEAKEGLENKQNQHLNKLAKHELNKKIDRKNETSRQEHTHTKTTSARRQPKLGD